MLALRNSYLIMRQDGPLQVPQEGTISVLQGTDLGDTKTAAEVKNQPVPLSDRALICFSSLGPHFYLVNVMPVIPAGMWGRFVRAPQCVSLVELLLLGEGGTRRSHQPGD